MNLIGNNCIPAYVYQARNLGFQNPFMWSVILPDDFMFLYRNYDTIDFSKFSIGKEFVKKLNMESYYINIDEHLKVYFIHHKQDDRYEVPQKDVKVNNVDIFYRHIERYLLEKYVTRMKRMKHEEPKFLCAANGIWTMEQTIEFSEIDSKYEKIMILYDSLTFNKISDSIKKCLVPRGISVAKVSQIFLNSGFI